jgi:hypothetical protein
MVESSKQAREGVVRMTDRPIKYRAGMYQLGHFIIEDRGESSPDWWLTDEDAWGDSWVGSFATFREAVVHARSALASERVS